MKSLKKLLFGGNRPVIRNILSALFYCIALLALDLGFRFIFKDGVVPLTKDHVPFLFSLCWCAILTALSFLLPRLVRRIYLILTVLIYSVFAFAHAIFYTFNGTYLTLSQAIFAGEGAAFFDWSYFSISKKLVVIILGAIFLSVIAALIIPKTKYSIIRIICALLAFGLGIAGINIIKDKSFTEDGSLVWNSARTPLEIYESFNDTRSCLHMMGLYQYTFKDVANVTGLADLIATIQSGDTIEALDDYYESREIDPDNEMTGIFKDKNLIFIQLESIDTWMVNETAMPFLYGLRNESINFESFYAPKFLAASTFNTENIANTGLVTPMNSAKLSYFTDNYYPYSAANLFLSEGYEVESFHRSVASIYSRGLSHENWGYTKYYNGYDMGMEDLNLDTHMMAAYEEMTDGDKFMSFVITYSGHGPYDGESVEVSSYYDIIRSKLPEDVKEEYIYALCHAYETDQFLKMLCERLEEDGLLEDTVLVMYSDHYDHYVTDESILIENKGGSDKNLWCNIPFIIYNKSVEPMTVEKTVSTFDILPTIVNLFDLDYDGRHYVGNDAFSENGGYAFFQNHSWIEDGVYFNVDTSTPTEESKKRNEEIAERLNMNWDTVKTDYFAKKRDK